MDKKSLLKKSLAEGIGAFALVFAGCGGAMVADRFPGALQPAVVPLLFGLAIAVMIYAVGHLSGAHFNPAVTVAFSVVRHFPRREVLPYCAAQVTGGLIAMALLSRMLPAGAAYGATLPMVPPAAAFCWEMILTFLLMFVITAVATDTRAVGTMAGVAIGGTVMLCAWLGGPVTGASMNPARSLAPALFQGTLSSLWIYWTAPFLGALAGAFTYERIRCGEAKPHAAKGCC